MKTGSSPPQSETSFTRLRFLAAAIVFAAVIILLIPHAQRIPYRFSITYNEGWNLYHSARAASGEALYSNANQFTPLIYPPLYFHLLGIFQSADVDPLTAGRIIAFISLLFVAVIAAACVKKCGGDTIGAMTAGAFFCGTVAAFAPQYSGMNDPQLTAQVFTCAGFLFFIIDRLRYRNLVWSAILIATGLFVKHNVIAIPLTILLVLLIVSRKHLLIWAGTLAIAITIFTLLTILFDGSSFLAQMLSSRLVSASKMLNQTRQFGTLMAVPLIVSVFWIWSVIQSRHSHGASAGPLQYVQSLGLLLLFSLITGVASSAGFGTALNMFFEAFFCLAVIAGLGVSSYWAKRLPGWISALLIIALFGTVLWKTPQEASSLLSGETLEHFEKQQSVFQSDATFLSEKKGQAICGNLTLCFYAGKSFLLDPFNVSQKIVTGSMDEEAVLQLIRSGKAEVIQIKEQRSHEVQVSRNQPEMFPDSFFTQNMIAEIRGNYSVERRTATGTFYIRTK